MLNNSGRRDSLRTFGHSATLRITDHSGTLFTTVTVGHFTLQGHSATFRA